MDKKITLFCIALLYNILVFAQGTYLTVPDNYFFPLYENGGCQSVSQPQVTKFTPWIVFSQQSENPVFSDSGLNNQITTVELGKEFVVVNRQGNSLEVVELDKVKGAWEKRGNWEPKYATDPPLRGWISENNVMASISCQQVCDIQIPHAPPGLYPLKVVYQNTGVNDYMNFYGSPCGNSVSQRLDPTEIFGYIYKKVRCGNSNWYLIGNKPTINALDEGKDVLLGWKPENGISFWRHNLGYEFNWSPDAVTERNNNQNMAIKAWDEDDFNGKTVLTDYRNDQRSYPLENQRYSRREPGYRLDARFPILQVDEIEDGRLDKAKIGRLLLYGDDYEHDFCGVTLTTHEIAAKALELVRLLKKEAQTINLVFVIDATGSMLKGDRRAVVLNSINEALGELKRKINEEKLDIVVNVGACLYRDAASVVDGQSYTVEFCDLNQNFIRVTRWLESHLVKRPGDLDQLEAYFCGLDSAFTYFSSQMGTFNTNYFIELGDAGNHNRSDFTTTSFSTLKEFLDGCSLDDYIALQYNRDTSRPDIAEAVDSFYLETNRIVDVIASRNNERVIPENAKDSTNLGRTATESGTSYFVYPDRGSELDDQVLSDEIKKAIENSSKSLHRKVKSLANLMRNPAQRQRYICVYDKLEKFVCDNARLEDGRSYCFCEPLKDQLMQYIIAYLRGGEGSVFEKLDVIDNVFINNQKTELLQHNLFQNVIYTKDRDLQIINSIDIGTRDGAVEAWVQLLANILHVKNTRKEVYVTPISHAISLLTGYSGLRKYDTITVGDIIRMNDVQFNNYRLEWGLTKLYILSILNSRYIISRQTLSPLLSSINFIRYSNQKTQLSENDLPRLASYLQLKDDRNTDEYFKNYPGYLSVPIYKIRTIFVETGIYSNEDRNFEQMIIDFN